MITPEIPSNRNPGSKRCIQCRAGRYKVAIDKICRNCRSYNKRMRKEAKKK